MAKVIEAKPFFMPLEIEKAWQISNEVLLYWVYWEPCGDECIVGKLLRNGFIIEGDNNWQAYLELEALNPIMQTHELGSSEDTAKEVLLVDKVKGKFYFIPKENLHELLRKLVLKA